MSTVPTTTSTERPAIEPAGLAPAHAIRFTRGLPGFEACRSFVLMTAAGDSTLQYLKSVEGPPAAFLAIDPRRVDPAYSCELTDADRLALGASGEAPLLWLALVTVEQDGTAVVNLRAPIVINPARMVGQQVIPHQSVYPLRHVLLRPE